MSARGLPETIEDLDGWLDQILRWMHATALVTEKRSLKMDAEGTRRDGVAILVRLSFSCFNGVGEAIECGIGRVQRCSHRGGKVSGDAVGREELAQPRQFGGHRPHEIDTRAAVHVHVEEPRGQRGVAEIDYCCAGRDVIGGAR